MEQQQFYLHSSAASAHTDLKKLRTLSTRDLKPPYVLTAKEDIDTATGYHENFHRENLRLMVTIIIHMNITTTTVQ